METSKSSSKLLDADQAIAYLRLDYNKRPLEALWRYRRMGLIRGYKIGRFVRYRVEDLERFIQDRRC